MSDPRRLFDDGTLEQRAMLDAAKDDAPSKDAELRARIALGLAAPIFSAPTPPDPVTPTVTAGSSATAGSAATVVGSSVTKLGVVLFVAATGAAGWIAIRELEAPPLSEVRDHRPPARPSSSTRIAASPIIIVAPPVVEVPPISPKPMLRRARRADSAPDPDARLRAELDLIRSARDRLTVGDASDAEALLDRYDLEIGRGALAEEAAALRVDVSFALDRSDKTARAEAFLRDHPSSPHADRARRLLDQR